MLETIDRQRHKRLLLVHAAAGYGKTILLSQWHGVVQSSGAVAVWVDLETADSLPERFLASLASGLAYAGVPLAQELRTEADASDPLETFLRLAERSTRETWLILEDWHRVEAGPITTLMESLLRFMPPNWHVALSSRTKPRLNLLMLRARGQLLEIGQEALRLSADETRMLLTGRALPPNAADELVELTEGWPIALQLAQLWIEQRGELDALRSSFLETIDGMAEFLAAEVFEGLAPELKDFLLESAVLPTFTSDLTDFAREQANSAALIEALRSPNGLTVPLYDRPGWFRHHRLLGEYLRRESHSLPTGRIRHLHSRAALWFERRGMLLEAVEHARLSGDQARTVQLVEDAGCVDICIRSGAPTVRALLDSLPADVVRERPRLRAAYTAMNLKLGSIGQAGQLLAELQASIDADSMDAVLGRDLLIVQSLRQCFIDESPSMEDLADHRRSLENFANADWWLKGLMQNVQGRLEMRRGLLREAVQSLGDADQVFAAEGSAQGHFFMLANLAICHLFLGRHEQAQAHLDQAHLVLKRQLSGATDYIGIVHTVEALLLYERNELPAAGHAAQLALAGLELAEGCFEQYFSAIQVAARVTFAASGLDAAVRVLHRGRRLARYHGLARMEGLLDCLELRLAIDAEQWGTAQRLADVPSVLLACSGESGWMEHDLSLPALCLLALHDGRAREARVLARDMAARCRDAGRLPAEIRGRIIEAIAATELEDWEGALAAVRVATELASGEGLIQPFFEIDGPILPLLRDFQQAGAVRLAPAHAEFLAGLILRMIAAGKAKAHAEHLTAREGQILELLRHGGSNKVIARALDLTENAVKFHLKNVFRKLGVDNRAMAAQVAQRLDLSVPS